MIERGQDDDDDEGEDDGVRSSGYENVILTLASFAKDDMLLLCVSDVREELPGTKRSTLGDYVLTTNALDFVRLTTTLWDLSF